MLQRSRSQRDYGPSNPKPLVSSHLVSLGCLSRRREIGEETSLKMAENRSNSHQQKDE